METCPLKSSGDSHANDCESEMRRSLYKKSLSVRALIAVLRTANATVNGDTVDRWQGGAQEYRTVLFVCYTGLVTDGTWTFAVQESPDNSVWTAPAADAVHGTAPVFISTSDDVVADVGYAGMMRYCRLTLTSTGSTTGALVGASAVLYQGTRDR